MWPTEHRRQPAQTSRLQWKTKLSAPIKIKFTVKRKKRKEKETDLYWLFYTDSLVQEALIDPGGKFCSFFNIRCRKENQSRLYSSRSIWLNNVDRNETHSFCCLLSQLHGANTPEDRRLVSSPNQDFGHVTVMLTMLQIRRPLASGLASKWVA